MRIKADLFRLPLLDMSSSMSFAHTDLFEQRMKKIRMKFNSGHFVNFLICFPNILPESIWICGEIHQNSHNCFSADFWALRLLCGRALPMNIGWPISLTEQLSKFVSGENLALHEVHRQFSIICVQIRSCIRAFRWTQGMMAAHPSILHTWQHANRCTRVLLELTKEIFKRKG
jgi:hypothetical protein